jgi:hypothetical protein
MAKGSADRLREMREENAARAEAVAKSKPQKIAEVKLAIEAVSHTLATPSVDKPGASTYKYRDPEARKSYQRDLMRKRRTKNG